MEYFEEPIEEAPWAIYMVEGVKCNHCGDTTVDDKTACNQNGCPYDMSGDDGMY